MGRPLDAVLLAPQGRLSSIADVLADDVLDHFAAYFGEPLCGLDAYS